MEWSQEEIKFLRQNESLLNKEDYDEFYVKAYSELGSDISHRIMLGVFLVSPEPEFELILEVEKDRTSPKIINYELYLRSPRMPGFIQICSSRMSGNPDDFSILGQCKIALRWLKFDESTTKKILDRVKVKRV